MLLALNGRFYGLLLRRLGPRGAAAGVALHAVHHLTAVAAVPAAVALHLARPRPARAGGSLVPPAGRAGPRRPRRRSSSRPEPDGRPPELSFVVVTDRFAYIRELVEALRGQSEPRPDRARDRNAVRGASSGSTRTPSRASPSASSRSGRHSSPRAARSPPRATSAPYVFIGETHCFPEPGWARAILAAHAEGWDTVVPVLTNANPHGRAELGGVPARRTARNWAPAPARELGASPTYNASMRRELVGEHFADGGQGFVDLPRAERASASSGRRTRGCGT